MEVVQQVFAVLFVFGLLGLAVWKLRAGGASFPSPRLRSWPGARNSGRALETVERVALTAQHAVHLVRVHGRELVVVTHPQGCSLLLQQAAGEQGEPHPFPRGSEPASLSSRDRKGVVAS